MQALLSLLGLGQDAACLAADGVGGVPVPRQAGALPPQPAALVVGAALQPGQTGRVRLAVALRHRAGPGGVTEAVIRSEISIQAQALITSVSHRHRVQH